MGARGHSCCSAFSSFVMVPGVLVFLGLILILLVLPLLERLLGLDDPDPGKPVDEADDGSSYGSEGTGSFLP